MVLDEVKMSGDYGGRSEVNDHRGRRTKDQGCQNRSCTPLPSFPNSSPHATASSTSHPLSDEAV